MKMKGCYVYYTYSIIYLCRTTNWSLMH